VDLGRGVPDWLDSDPHAARFPVEFSDLTVSPVEAEPGLGRVGWRARPGPRPVPAPCRPGREPRSAWCPPPGRGRGGPGGLAGRRPRAAVCW
jgi:hypothetical protein